MDIVGIVSDKSNSTKYKEGDRIMGIGTVGNSAAGSFQTHALIQERDTCLVSWRYGLSWIELLLNMNIDT